MSAFKGGGSGFTKGMVQKFRAGQVPDGWAAHASLGALPTGAIVALPVNANSTGNQDAVFVSQGTAPGVWRAANGVLQRYSLATDTAEGPAYAIPLTGIGGTIDYSVEVHQGTKLYLMAVPSSTNTAGNRSFLFDTETQGFTQLANFPGTVDLSRQSAVLPDGRVLLTFRWLNGAQAAAGTAFFALCDPATNAIPVVLSVPLPLVSANTVRTGLQVLPSGSVLVVGGGLETDGQLGSCVLTVSGDTITAGPAIATGVTSATNATLVPTATGAFLNAGSTAPASAANGRTFIEGLGWALASAPLSAYPATGFYGTRCRFYSGTGWLCIRGTVMTWLLTSHPAPSTAIVEAIKL